MKRVYTMTVGFLLATVMAFAQNESTPAGPFTLDKCIQYALQNSVNAQNATLDEDIAKARVRETTGMGLPQVTVSSGVAYNQKLPRFFQRYNPPTDGGFSFFPEIPGLEPGSVVAANNFFQLQANGDAKVQVSQLIFNGSYFVGLQAAAAFKDLAYKSSAATRQTIIQNVSKAYYGVLVNTERTKLFDANISRVDSLLRSTRALNENGFAEKIDVDRVQVAYNNLLAERDKFNNLKELSLALLKFQMNYPMGETLEIAGNIQDLNVEAYPDVKDGWDYSQRPDYQVLEVNRKLQSLNLRNQYAGALPTIAAFGTFGYQTQSPDIGGVFKTNTRLPFDSDEIGPDKWYSYSMFGINLTWDLFTGLQRSNKIQQEKMTLQKIENSFRSARAGIDLEVQQGSIMFDNALKTLNAQRANMDLAANIARITKIKFEQGVGSNLEVVDAESSLREAQTNYYNALFDALVAKVDLDKALGKLSVDAGTNNK